jgi:hypothetical protein
MCGLQLSWYTTRVKSRFRLSFHNLSARATEPPCRKTQCPWPHLRTTGILQQQQRERRQKKLEAAVTIDAARHAVLLAIHHAAVARREPAVIEGAHGADFAVDLSFAPLKTKCLAARELTLTKSGSDAMLLVDLTLCDVIKAVGHLRLADGRAAEKYSRCDCDC